LIFKEVTRLKDVLGLLIELVRLAKELVKLWAEKKEACK
jgi:hypothetical protein